MKNLDTEFNEDLNKARAIVEKLQELLKYSVEGRPSDLDDIRSDRELVAFSLWIKTLDSDVAELQELVEKMNVAEDMEEYFYLKEATVIDDNLEPHGMAR